MSSLSYFESTLSDAAQLYLLDQLTTYDTLPFYLAYPYAILSGSVKNPSIVTSGKIQIISNGQSVDFLYKKLPLGGVGDIGRFALCNLNPELDCPFSRGWKNKRKNKFIYSKNKKLKDAVFHIVEQNCRNYQLLLLAYLALNKEASILFEQPDFEFKYCPIKKRLKYKNSDESTFTYMDRYSSFMEYDHWLKQLKV